MKITEATYGIFDCETGGLDPAQHDLLEIGAQLYYGLGHDMPDEIPDRFSTLVAPTRPIPVESQAIHHLLLRDFEGAPKRTDALIGFRDFLPRNVVLVAHNSPFDVAFMELGDYPLVLDTKRMAHHLSPEAPSTSLQVLRYFYGFEDIDQEGLNPHRAIADVLVLAAVFFHLIALYRTWAESVCNGDEERLAKALEVETVMKWAARPYPILKWPVGPATARGKAFSELDDGLLRWALKQDFDTDLKWNVQNELDRRNRRSASQETLL